MRRYATVCLLVIGSTSLPARAGVSITADTAINLVVTSPSASSTLPNTSVHSDASNGLNAAFASTDSTTLTTSQSTSLNYYLTNNVSGRGTFRSDFMVVGNGANVPLPLSFNYVLTGGMSVVTDSLTRGVANTIVQVTVHTAFDWSVGTASLLGDSGTTTADTTGTLVGQSVGSLASLNLGLSLLSETRQSGTLVVDLYTLAASSPTGEARADFSVRLTSITVPRNFDAVPLSGLSVVFDSGLTVPISVESVPEPSTLAGVSLGALLAAVACLRRKG